MAGLINDQMNAAPAAPAGEPAPGQPPQDSQMPAGAPGEEQDDGQPAESNPAFQQAVALAGEVLYRQGGAKDVAAALAAAPDIAEGLANTAYDMVVTIDEKTQGQVPDELLMSLATTILTEVAEIAEAAGLEVTGKVIAAAMQQMILRYLTENGVDASQVQQAMQGVNLDELGASLDQSAGA